MNHRQQAAADFAARITRLGFAVYLAKSGEYGFITETPETRVLSFSMNDQTSLGGNYGPPSTGSGTGWKMDITPAQLKTADDVRAALYAHPPAFCGRSWKYLSTVKQHLALYGASSRYSKVKVI